MIDTHVHYDHKRFNRDREAHLAQLRAAGVKWVLNLPISLPSNRTMREKLGGYDWIYFGAGVHPNFAAGMPFPDAGTEQMLEACAGLPRTIAVGETGLDYNRISDDAARSRQKEWFARHIALAQSRSLPLVLHVREADGDAIDILRGHGGAFSGVAHCFSGDCETAHRYLDMGFLLGIGGAVTHENAHALRDAVARLPLDAFVLETDAPFVCPADIEDRRNTSLNLPAIAEFIARLKGTDAQKVIEAASASAENLFFGENHI